MDKNFNSSEIEARWSKHWEQENLFAPSGTGEPYCVAIPPPNVTGTLHMGHAFLNTIIDTFVRYQRMRGKNVLWQMGTDHAGIATQMVVERRLAAQGIDRKAIGREKFIEEVWQWKNISAGTIEKQLRRLGASVDWDSSRFTMDDDYCVAVKEAFVRLHEMGLIYRKKRLVNWDPVLQTAISDLEVSAVVEPSILYYIRYKFTDKNTRNHEGENYMVIATTRPETTLADGAVAVHPQDPRYTDVVGKMVQVPGTDRIIPVIADDYVKQDFGSGCVKITPAHDFNDYEVGLRHEMEVINLFTKDAHLNDNAPPAYRGLDRYAARTKVLEDFKKDGLLAKEQKHSHSPPRGDRSGVVLEPYLTDQWFVKMDGLANRAIDAVTNKDTEFVSPMWEKVYYSWLNEIQDWCVSRQLWWGHRIPAWHDAQGNYYVGRDLQEVRDKNNLPASVNLSQDEDVLDTWFSSALWTFATMGWPQDSERQQVFNPTTLLVTGFDIIFFWVARMIMMTLCLKNEVPFKHVYIHGLVRDSEGQKMSKSKGNILDPLDIIDGVDLEELLRKRTTDMMQPEKAQSIAAATKKHFPDGIAPHGTDALRFTFCAMATGGRDLNFDTSRCIGYRNFCNKLWNASRYVIMRHESYAGGDKQETSSDASGTSGSPLFHLREPLNQWMEAQFVQAATTVSAALDNYRIDLAAQAVYELVWHEYCDWYIELTKPLVVGANKSQQEELNKDLLKMLDKILRLAHPFIPFITEELWHSIIPMLGDVKSNQPKSIMVAEFPYIDKETSPTADKHLAAISWMRELIQEVRIMRSEANIPPKQELQFLLATSSKQEQQWLKEYQGLIMNLIKASELSIPSTESPSSTASETPSGISRLVGKGEVIAIFERSGVDKEKEMQRLQKDVQVLQKEIAQINSKLENKEFISKAPDNIVDGVKAKLSGKQEALAKLEKQLSDI